MKTFIKTIVAMLAPIVYAAPPTLTKTRRGYNVDYYGGDNWITSVNNSSDWRKRSDIQSIKIHQDITVEELQYICQTPSLEKLTIGTRPEYISCHPNLLDALSRTTKLTSLTISLDGPRGTPFQPSNLDSFLKINRNNKLTSLTIDVFSNNNTVFNDGLAANLLNFKKLKKLDILAESDFSSKFFLDLKQLPDLVELRFMNKSIDKQTMEALASLKLLDLEILIPEMQNLSLTPLQSSNIENLKLNIYNQAPRGLVMTL